MLTVTLKAPIYLLKKFVHLRPYEVKPPEVSQPLVLASLTAEGPRVAPKYIVITPLLIIDHLVGIPVTTSNQLQAMLHLPWPWLLKLPLVPVARGAVLIPDTIQKSHIYI